MESLKTDVEKPPQKKLKQSILTFQSQIKPLEVNKKRKLSNTVPIDDEPMLKCVKIILDRVDSADHESINNEVNVDSKDPISESNEELNDSFSSNDEEEKELDDSTIIDLNKTDSEDEEDVNITDSSSTPKPLTPKQLKHQLERRKRIEEKERLRQEKEKVREQKRLEKLKKKQEREEQKRKERDEKEKKRQAEIELKNEEKRLREEDRRKKEEQKEEERKKKELEKEEQENKKKKAAEAFVNFFVPKTKVNDKTQDELQLDNELNTSFMPFAIKNDMQMAPIYRKKISETRKTYLDEVLKTPPETDLYLAELKSGKITGSSKKTWIPNDKEDDVILIDDNEFGGDLIEMASESKKMKIKLLQFCDNRRPPYWGTWTKKSDFVKSRRPFGTDKKIFDYEVDSDDEWEEEEPGESLEVSDEEKEPEDDYEVDNEFFVPHGYLSDEEGRDEEDDSDTPPTEQIGNHEQKLKLLEEEFLAERKSKTDVLKPRVIGCVWSDIENRKPDETSDVIWRFLSYRKILCDQPVVLQDKDPDEFTLSPSSGASESSKKKLKIIPEKYLPDFVRLIHGNQNGKEFLYKEFRAYLLSREPELNLSKYCFNNKLKEFATYMISSEEGCLKNRHCWYVNKEIQETLKCDFSLPNKWTYMLTPKKQTKDINAAANESENNSPQNRSEKKLPPNNITKFTQILSEEEKCKQFKTEDTNDKPKIKKRVLFTTIPTTKNDTSTLKDSPHEKPIKKRVALVSVPKEPTPASKPPPRVNLLTQFIHRTTNKFSEATHNEEDDLIIIDLTEEINNKKNNTLNEDSTKPSTSQDRKILKEISENDSKGSNE